MIQCSLNCQLTDIENCHINTSQSLYDVVIIGAGAVGASIARELSKTNLKIILLEKSKDGASKSNSGIIHGGYDDVHGSMKSKVCHKGNRLFSELDKQLHFGFRNIGSLVLAYTNDDMKTLDSLLKNGVKNGVEGLVILNRDQVLEKEPNINPKVVGALYCHWTGITSPYEYVIALSENAFTNGVVFKLDHEVTDILITDPKSNQSRFLVQTDKEYFVHSRIVVNAAGNMADKISSMVGVNDFTIVPRIGEYILLDKTQSHFANHVLFPVPTRKGKGILVSPTFHGNLLLGPTSRPINERLTQRQILNLIIKSAKKSIPEFDPRTAITSYTGLRSSSSRGDFIIEETKVSGFINVAGIDSPGLTASPAVALMVRDIIQQSLKTNYFVNTTPNFNFNPNRIPIIIKKTTGFKGTIDNIDPNLNIICRCELVTESEIIDSISRPLGSHDTDSVKRRTRAGMGKCQGNFCEPRVAALISKNIHVPIEDVVRRSIGSSVLPHLTVNDDDRRLLLEIANAPEPLLGTSKL